MRIVMTQEKICLVINVTQVKSAKFPRGPLFEEIRKEFQKKIEPLDEPISIQEKLDVKDKLKMLK